MSPTAAPWRMSWSRRAACLDMPDEVFFPERGQPTTEAKRVCRSCPVQPDCLAYALERNEQHGVWGGLSDRERDALKRRAS